MNVLLFVWVGNETFAHWRQLPGSLWAGVCDYDQFWSHAGRVAQSAEAGRVAQSAEAMTNFSFWYVTSRKNQLFCAPILYRYIIIKLYNKTTIFSSLLPICVCWGVYSAPQTPSWERLCIPKKVSLIFFHNDMPVSYCIFCIKRVFLKPFGKSYLYIYVRKLNFKCIFLSFYFRPPPPQCSWNMHQIKAEWVMFHIILGYFVLGQSYDSFCKGLTH